MLGILGFPYIVSTLLLHSETVDSIALFIPRTYESSRSHGNSFYEQANYTWELHSRIKSCTY